MAEKHLNYLHQQNSWRRLVPLTILLLALAAGCSPEEKKKWEDSISPPTITIVEPAITSILKTNKPFNIGINIDGENSPPEVFDTEYYSNIKPLPKRRFWEFWKPEYEFQVSPKQQGECEIAFTAEHCSKHLLHGEHCVSAFKTLSFLYDHTSPSGQLQLRVENGAIIGYLKYEDLSGVRDIEINGKKQTGSLLSPLTFTLKPRLGENKIRVSLTDGLGNANNDIKGTINYNPFSIDLIDPLVTDDPFSKTVTMTGKLNSNLNLDSIKTDGSQQFLPTLPSFLPVDCQTSVDPETINFTTYCHYGRDEGPIEMVISLRDKNGYKWQKVVQVTKQPIPQKEQALIYTAVSLTIMASSLSAFLIKREFDRKKARKMIEMTFLNSDQPKQALYFARCLSQKEQEKIRLQVKLREEIDRVKSLVAFSQEKEIISAFSHLNDLYRIVEALHSKNSPIDSLIFKKIEDLFHRWVVNFSQETLRVVTEKRMKSLIDKKPFFDLIIGLQASSANYPWFWQEVPISLREEMREISVVVYSDCGSLIRRYGRILEREKQTGEGRRELTSVVKTLSDWGDFRGATAFINEVQDRELQKKLNLQLREAILKMKQNLFKGYFSTKRAQAQRLLDARLQEYRMPPDEEADIRRISMRLDVRRAQIEELRVRFRKSGIVGRAVSQIELELVDCAISSRIEEIDQRLGLFYLVLKLINGEVRVADFCSNARPPSELKTAFEILKEAECYDLANGLVQIWPDRSTKKAQADSLLKILVEERERIRSQIFKDPAQARQLLGGMRLPEYLRQPLLATVEGQETILQFRQQFSQSPTAQTMLQQAFDLLKKDQMTAFSQQLVPLKTTSDLLSAADFESAARSCFVGRSTQEIQTACQILLEAECFDLLSCLIPHIPDVAQRDTVEMSLHIILVDLRDRFYDALNDPDKDLDEIRSRFLKARLPPDLTNEFQRRLIAEQDKLSWLNEGPDTFLIPIVEKGMRDAKGLSLVEAISAAVRAKAILGTSHKNVPYILGFNESDKIRATDFYKFLPTLKQRLIFLLRELDRLSNASISPDLKTHLLVNTIHSRAMQWLKQATDEEGIWPIVLEKWLKAEKPIDVPVLILVNDGEDNYTLNLFDR